MLVNNDDWLRELRYIDFLREYGRHFTINRMLTFDSVRLRLEREQPLTFLEFNYMVMQAYDFLELARRHDCRLQMGGSDQWGNIVNGVELARRVDGRKLFGATTPLITTATGAKMGKTAAGAVWLNEDRLPAFDYWQYWRNIDGCRCRPVSAAVHRAAPGRDRPARSAAGRRAERGQDRPGQRGDEALPRRGRRRGPPPMRRARCSPAATAMPPACRPPRSRATSLLAGINVADLLSRTGLAASKGEARRLIRGGGARLNDARIDDEAMTVDTAHLQGDQLTLSAGRKRHVRVRVV